MLDGHTILPTRTKKRAVLKGKTPVSETTEARTPWFAMLNPEITYDKRLKGTDFKVYIMLCAHAKPMNDKTHSHTFVNQKTIARKLDIDRTQVNRSIQRLTSTGWLSSHEDSDGKIHYYVRLVNSGDSADMALYSDFNCRNNASVDHCSCGCDFRVTGGVTPESHITESFNRYVNPFFFYFVENTEKCSLIFSENNGSSFKISTEDLDSSFIEGFEKTTSCEDTSSVQGFWFEKSSGAIRYCSGFSIMEPYVESKVERGARTHENDLEGGRNRSVIGEPTHNQERSIKDNLVNGPEREPDFCGTSAKIMTELSQRIEKETFSQLKEIMRSCYELIGSQFSMEDCIKVVTRLQSGYSTQDLLEVLRFKCDTWLGTKAVIHLKPGILYGKNFGRYLEGAKQWKIQQDIDIETDKMFLKQEHDAAVATRMHQANARRYDTRRNTSGQQHQARRESNGGRVEKKHFLQHNTDCMQEFLRNEELRARGSAGALQSADAYRLPQGEVCAT